MLKRLWLVVSLGWTVMMLAMIYIAADHTVTVNAVIAALLPWVAGPVLLVIFRYVFRGRVTARNY